MKEEPVRYDALFTEEDYSEVKKKLDTHLEQIAKNTDIFDALEEYFKSNGYEGSVKEYVLDQIFEIVYQHNKRLLKTVDKMQKENEMDVSPNGIGYDAALCDVKEILLNHNE